MQKSTHAGDVIIPAVATAVRGAAFVFFVDRVTKEIAFGLPEIPSHPLSSLITLVHHKNYGVIANIPIPQPLIIAATILVLVLVGQALYIAIRAGRMGSAGMLGVLIGGAFGNLYDRVSQGFVFDWILLFGQSAINIADIAIAIGALGYFIGMRQLEAPSMESNAYEKPR